MNTPPPLPILNRKSPYSVPLLVVSVFLGSFFLSFYFRSHTSSDYAIGVSSASWMPKGSSHGAFFEGPGFFIIAWPEHLFEFDISEKDFVSYLKSIDCTPMEIQSPVHIPRYLKQFIREQDYKTRQQFEIATQAIVTNGLVYKGPLGRNGSGSLYAFDRDKGRAFIDIWTR